MMMNVRSDIGSEKHEMKEEIELNEISKHIKLIEQHCPMVNDVETRTHI